MFPPFATKTSVDPATFLQFSDKLFTFGPFGLTTNGGLLVGGAIAVVVAAHLV
jgi:hypothetical protein